MFVILALEGQSREVRTSRDPWLRGEFEPTGDPDSTNQPNNAAFQHIQFSLLAAHSAALPDTLGFQAVHTSLPLPIV